MGCTLTSVCLFENFFSAIFFIDVDTLENIIPIFLLLKYGGKNNNSSGDEEHYSCELSNFELKKFANLSEQELNRLVEQRHSALGDGPKKTTNWSVSTFRG